MSQPRLSVTTTAHNDSLVVEIEGEIDLSTAKQFERELLDASSTNPSLIVDLRNVEFMDSTGIGVLVRTSKKLTSDGGAMTLVCGEGPVRRVLEVSGLDGVIPVFDNLESAVEA